jgi:competence protein ComFC
MPVEINPKKIIGAWDEGYSLDQHTIESRLVGYNAYGHAEFSTKRSPLGELLFRFKYRFDRQCIDPIVETAVQFLESWDISPAILIPVPASNTARRDQPVIEIAKCLSKQSSDTTLPGLR